MMAAFKTWEMIQATAKIQHPDPYEKEHCPPIAMQMS